MRNHIFLFLFLILRHPIYPQGLWHTEEKQISLNEVAIKNNEIKNFCTNTLVPILHTMDFDKYENVLKMRIDWKGVWQVEFLISNSGCLENSDLPEGYIQGLSIIDGYPMKVEAPEQTPFFQLLPNDINFRHKESNFGLDGDMFWRFMFIDNKLRLNRMWAVPLYENIDGKNMNPKTGYLE